MWLCIVGIHSHFKWLYKNDKEKNKTKKQQAQLVSQQWFAGLPVFKETKNHSLILVMVQASPHSNSKAKKKAAIDLVLF